MARKHKEITAQEKLFGDAYCSNGFDRKKAVVDAGFRVDNIPAKAASLLKRPVVVEYISSVLDKKKNTFFINELDILEGLYKEAILTKKDGGTQQGRIQAWIAMGKEFGMFDSKVRELKKPVEDTGTTINIINYNSSSGGATTTEKDITPVIDEDKLKEEIVVALDGVKISDYSDNNEEED